MRELFILIAHLLVTLAKLTRPGGLGAVVTESLAVKHQLLIMKRAQPRAPKLTAWDRLILGVCALFVSPKRLRKLAVILRPSTLLAFHHALVKRKYHLLYSPRKRRRPGPKGPTKQLIDAIIEMKRRNPCGDDVSLEEVKVLPRSPLIGMAIGAVERANTRLRIVGLKRGADPIAIIPDEQTIIEAGDLIVVIGARTGLERLAESASP